MSPLSHAHFQAAMADRYVMDRVLGRGGAGTVYLARDVKHGRPVAIKVLNPETLEGLESKSFLREIRLTARLQHPHILPLLDSGEAAGCPYYVMPYVKGGSLRELLDEKKRLSIDEVMAITSDVSDALHYAHENRVVHCDIKPENILLSNGHAVIADFGVSRAVFPDRSGWRAAIDTSAGTPAYVSPEQASGDDEIGGHTDQFSLACLIHEMLAGEPPFMGDTDMATVAGRFTRPAPDLRAIRRNIPSGMAAAVRKALSVDPRRRHHSVGRFYRAIEKAASTRRRSIREAAGLGWLRTMVRMRRTARRFSYRQGRLTAERLIARSRESIETAALGAKTSTGAGLREAR